VVSCRDEAETVINGQGAPCATVHVTPSSDTVAVGDSIRFSVLAQYASHCANVSREIKWALFDCAPARISATSDTSA
jgi:hypothetical protein